MFLKNLVEDRLCKGRFIGYFDHAIQVFYKHELHCLAELFGCIGSSLSNSFSLPYETQALYETLYFDPLTRGPPTLSAFLDSPGSYQLSRSVALSTCAFAILSSGVHALPTGYQSVAGNVQFNQAGSTLNVSTQATRSIANYQSFNVAQGETVNFNLPSAQSVILNRVVGPNSPSQIFGAMNSNGQVFLTNPSGIIFGPSSQVNVGALHASTLGISDQDFMNGQYTFKQDPNLAPAAVVNQGSIQTAKGGYVVFSGGAIQNAGNINAPKGHIDLAVGNQITMAVDDNLAVSVTVDESLKQKVNGFNSAIENTGTLSAAGGSIKAQTNLANAIYQTAINNEGIVSAQGFETVNGEIVFSDTPGSGAIVQNTGTIDASGSANTPNGGLVSLSGDYVLQEGSILAEGQEGGTGGHIELSSTLGTLLGTGGTTSVKGAGENSNSGSIRVWSDNVTLFDTDALVDVSGGIVSGNAGFVELSGKNDLTLDGTLQGFAHNGQGGRLLIDPNDIVIVNGGGSTPGQPGASPQERFADHAGLTVSFDPTGTGQFFGHGFTDITLQATGNITVNSPFDTSVAAYGVGNTTQAVSLNLLANNNITVNAAVTTHNAAITMLADNDNNNTGSITITGTGSVNSNAGFITLQGAQIHIGGAVNAGASGTVQIQQTSGTAITIGNASDSDTGVMADISLPELNLITANKAYLGAYNTGGLTVGGNISMPASGAGSYGLILQSNGIISINNAINTNGHLCNLYAPEIKINQPITASRMFITPPNGIIIHIGGSTADADTGTVLDISQSELGNLTVGSLTIGSIGYSGGLSIIGNLNVSGTPGTAGNYDLAFANRGLITNNSHIISLGNNNLTMNAGGTVNTGQINGGTGNINITSGSTLTADGGINLSGTGTCH